MPTALWHSEFGYPLDGQGIGWAAVVAHLETPCAAILAFTASPMRS